MHVVYKNIDDYNSDKENKILIVFDDKIADMIHNKKLNSIVPELFIRGRKLNISLVFISQSYRKYTDEPYSFLVIDTILASNNPLRFRKNIFNIKCKFLECNSIM